jgi:hypothetical protein
VTSPATFDQIDQSRADGADAILLKAADALASEKQWQEWFQVKQMQIRHELGLPLDATGDDQLAPETRNKLEDKLFDVCREVGLQMMRDGQVAQGWMYLRVAGDRALAAEELQKVEIDEDNMEEVIDVAIQENVAPAYGYKLALEHHGTCNSITLYESVISQLPLTAQQECATLLVAHLQEELIANVSSDIEQQEGTTPTEKSLAALIADREWLFASGGYHIDTSHLNSTIRFARILTEVSPLRMAKDLTEYGRRLAPQYQFNGEEPFSENYESHGLLFSALLGEDCDEAVQYFREKAETVDVREHGSSALEIYIHLLGSTGRVQDAMQEAVRLSPDDMDISSGLAELAAKCGEYQLYCDYCRKKGNVLGYARGLALQSNSGV